MSDFLNSLAVGAVVAGIFFFAGAVLVKATPLTVAALVLVSMCFPLAVLNSLPSPYDEED